MYDDQPVEADVQQKLVSLATSMATLRHDVDSGRLQLDPEAGKQLREMLARQVEQVDTWLSQARGLSRQAPLGEHPVGWAMAAKFEQRAGGGGTSLTAVFTSYRQILQDTDDTVAEAMRRYRDVEERTRETFNRLAT